MAKDSDIGYTFLGRTIIDISIMYGAFLIVWSTLISFWSASQSFTSWIPAFVGTPIFFLGLASNIYPKKQKFFMHLVVLLGLLCVLGGLDFVRDLWKWLTLGNPFSNAFAWGSKLMLLISGLTFCYLCIKSFLHIRKTKALSNTKI